MAKRRVKKRSHTKTDVSDTKQIPKSMVIRVGQTSMGNHSLNQLVKDFRMIMQPHTAVKLKERKSNKLKDFVVMCGPLGVSHLFVFTQSEKTGNISLKVSRTPQGPTITFKVTNYSLGKDIKKFLRRPKSLNKEDVMDPPLLVLNGFGIKNKDEDKSNVEKVVVSMFQNIFPSLNPSKAQLNSIKRVFMINKDHQTNEISMRHYAINIGEVDISRNLKKLYESKGHLNRSVPNLHKKQDIASLILDHDIGAYTSESEVDDDAIIKVVEKPDTHIKNVISKNKDNHNDKVMLGTDVTPLEEETRPHKKAIKLTEVGPRLTLNLIKIEDGICSGKVLHHEYIKKTDSEIRALEKRYAEKMKMKEQRRKEQEANIAKKKAVKDAKKQRKLERRKQREVDSENGVISEAEIDSDYRSGSSDSNRYSDVPSDLDSDLFSEVEN